MELQDPWRAATLLIQIHGLRARAETVLQIIAMRQSGDMPGLALWKAVLEAVLYFERFDPADERVLH
jgi:hypothetical protein